MDSARMLPSLCSVYLEDKINECFKWKSWVCPRGKRIEYIGFDDDMVVFSETKEQVIQMLLNLNYAWELRMRINEENKKIVG